MDEPFSAVDEQTRRKFQEDLLALEGMTERLAFRLAEADPYARNGCGETWPAWPAPRRATT